MEPTFNELFPTLNDSELQKELDQVAVEKSLDADELLMETGKYIKFIPLVTAGRLKVYREDDEGHELFLYYINPGETCAISLVCSERDRKSKIKAVTVEDTKFLAIPIRCMDEWMSAHKPWYYFVMETYRKRFEETLNTIDSIAFHKLDERLLEYLNKISVGQNSQTVKTTHQDIANELNSSREVISRLLKQMEKNGMVQLSRNQIDLLS